MWHIIKPIIIYNSIINYKADTKASHIYFGKLLKCIDIMSIISMPVKPLYCFIISLI